VKQDRYTTALSKGQGMIPETIALLNIWNPGMSVPDLKSKAVSEGIIGRATALRVQDIVGRVFAARYLRKDCRPALRLKQLIESSVAPKDLNQIFLIHTARVHTVLHDFITELYWPKYTAGAPYITRSDALGFLEQAADIGRISPRWSETIMLRVARYLTGCLTDFQLAGENRGGKRDLRPFTIEPLTTLYLAHDLHFDGFGDTALVRHEDWRLFGLEPYEVEKTLERVGNGHLIPQFSGDLVRITWTYKTMEEALRGIAAAGF